MESREAELPFFADGNTPSAIILVVITVRIAAPLIHCCPDMVQPCVGHAMGCAPLSGLFIVKAATASGVAFTHFGTFNDTFFAAITQAQPGCSTLTGCSEPL